MLATCDCAQKNMNELNLAARRFAGNCASKLDDEDCDIPTGSKYPMALADTLSIVKAGGSLTVRFIRCPAATQTDRIRSGAKI